MSGLALLVAALIGLSALLACAAGVVWGPLILAFAFAGCGLVMLGMASWGPILGVALLAGALAQVLAANQFWAARRMAHGPSGAWRATSSVIGLAGLAGIAFLVYAYLAFLAWISSL